MGDEGLNIRRNALGKIDPAKKKSVFSDGGPVRTFGWQLIKAVIAALVVVIYSRGMGAYGRGALSVLLLYLQLTLMVSEMVAGGALANLLTKYSVRRILPTAWAFLLLVLCIAYLIGWLVWVIPNAGDYPICLDHPKVITLNLLFFQGLFLGGLNIQYNLYQAQGWVNQRNRLQVSMEVLKLLGLLLCFEAMYGFIIPKNAAIELSVSRHIAERLMDGQTLDYLHGFNEMAILWILVYASGLVWVYSLWQSRSLFKGGVMQSIQSSPQEMGQSRPGLNNGSFWSSIQPPKEMFNSGFLSQLGHILLFLLYRLPLWWMAAQYGNSQAGLLANALLIADTIWIFGNSYGTILHSRMLVSSGSFSGDRNNGDVSAPASQQRKFNKLLSRYVVISSSGTLLAVLLAMIVPNALYVFVFGETFSGLKETLFLISPAVIFLGISAPIGHYLHAQNRFKDLIVSYGCAVVVLVVLWFGVDWFTWQTINGIDRFEMPKAVQDTGILSPGLFSRMISIFGKFMSVNLAFFVLLFLNYRQVKHILRFRANVFVLLRFLRRYLAK
jgi:O-antigen/teichoic acid export membrane protein